MLTYEISRLRQAEILGMSLDQLFQDILLGLTVNDHKVAALELAALVGRPEVDGGRLLDDVIDRSVVEGEHEGGVLGDVGDLDLLVWNIFGI